MRGVNRSSVSRPSLVHRARVASYWRPPTTWSSRCSARWATASRKSYRNRAFASPTCTRRRSPKASEPARSMRSWEWSNRSLRGSAAEELYEDDIAVVVRAKHPLVGGRVDAARLARYSRIIVESSLGVARSLDAALEAPGATIASPLVVASFVAGAMALEKSDSFLVAPLRAVEALGTLFPLRSLSFEGGRERLSVSLIWHARTDSDAGGAFFRDVLRPAVKANPSGRHAGPSCHGEGPLRGRYFRSARARFQRGAAFRRGVLVAVISRNEGRRQSTRSEPRGASAHRRYRRRRHALGRNAFQVLQSASRCACREERSRRRPRDLLRMRRGRRSRRELDKRLPHRPSLDREMAVVGVTALPD